MKIASPMEQFQIHPIIKLGVNWIDFSITNSTIYMFIVLFLIILLAKLTLTTTWIIPKRWQSLMEYIYEFIQNLVKDQVGEKGSTYVPFIFTLFIFIVFCNLVGMVPYSFTVTTHIVVTFAISLMILTGVTILGLLHHGIRFFKLFLPAGSPIILAPLLILLEIISYLIRAISLAVRLAANMMAGHTLLKILSSFAWKMLLAGGLLAVAGFFPIVILFALTGLELAIAILQAYVFTVLTCSYLNDSIHLH